MPQWVTLAGLGAADMPQCDSYEDESQNADTLPNLDEEPEVDPDAEILLLRGDKMARGMVCCKQDLVTQLVDPREAPFWIHISIK